LYHKEYEIAYLNRLGPGPGHYEYEKQHTSMEKEKHKYSIPKVSIKSILHLLYRRVEEYSFMKFQKNRKFQ